MLTGAPAARVVQRRRRHAVRAERPMPPRQDGARRRAGRSLARGSRCRRAWTWKRRGAQPASQRVAEAVPPVDRGARDGHGRSCAKAACCACPGTGCEVPAGDRSAVSSALRCCCGTRRWRRLTCSSSVEELALDRRRLLTTLLRAMEKTATVVAVAGRPLLPPRSRRRVRSELARELTDRGNAPPPQFRDRYQTSRKYAIPLLEFFDREGVTVQDRRRQAD